MQSNDQIIREVEQKVRAVMRTLPALVGNEVVNFASDSFRRQGWLGDSFEPWRKRKRVSRFGITPRHEGRAILVDTGKLRRGTRVISADWNEIRVGNAVPYAAAHNNGFRGVVNQTVKAHRRKRPDKNQTGAIAGRMNKRGTSQRVRFGQVSSGITFVKSHQRKINQRIPQRKFLGNSPYLNRNIQRLIALKLQKALQ